jgi:hypothetical protein
MSGITFGQLLAANWMLLAIVGIGLAVVSVVLVLRHRRRFRRLPATINGVRIECQGAVLDEDLVVERNWRATLLMTNVTRKPVSAPVLGARAVVMSGRKKYAGTVYLEREARELNPGDGLVAWVLVRLDGGGVPRRVEVELNSFMRVSATLSASQVSAVQVSPGLA